MIITKIIMYTRYSRYYIIIIIVMICVLLSGCIYLYDYYTSEREKFVFGAIFMCDYYYYSFARFEIRSVYGYTLYASIIPAIIFLL